VKRTADKFIRSLDAEVAKLAEELLYTLQVRRRLTQLVETVGLAG
jgi:hypothetical protein